MNDLQLHTLNKTQLKKEFKRRFNLYFYKGCKLAAVQLDGFTHKIFYVNEEGKRARLVYSGCMSQQEAKGYGWNDARAVCFFAGFYNADFQNNARELVFMKPATFLKYGG